MMRLYLPEVIEMGLDEAVVVRSGVKAEEGDELPAEEVLPEVIEMGLDEAVVVRSGVKAEEGDELPAEEVVRSAEEG
ncbi:hypothetical protein Droror1_Dr00027884 [Drosera rotundifolia]